MFAKLHGNKGHQTHRVAHKLKTEDTRQGKTTYWVDADDHRVNWTEIQWSDTLTKLFAAAGYATCTTHTLRCSAAQWAARCGARDAQIKATGRWSDTSNSYHRYIQAGIQDRDKWESLRQEDPIRKIWVFHPAVWTPTVSSSKS